MNLSLNSLGVYCTYSIDGCAWRGELRELQAHIDKTDHSGESLQYEHASRYAVTIYLLFILLIKSLISSLHHAVVRRGWIPVALTQAP